MSFWECPKCGGIPGVSFCCTSVDEKKSSKVTMPYPVAHAVKAANTGKICSLYTAGDDAACSGVYLMEKKHVDDLITTTQAEAYAEARVREALEEALIEVMRCKTSGIIRNDTVDKCADAIRALIPKESPCDTC